MQLFNLHLPAFPSVPPRVRPAQRRRRGFLALALSAASLVSTVAAADGGEVWDFPQPHPVGEINVTTRIVLRGVTGIYAEPPAPVVHQVRAGTKVEIATPFEDAHIVSIRWLKDGAPLASTDKTLVLTDVTSLDDGIYTAEVRREVEPAVLYASTVERIELLVGDVKPQKLVNISTRATIDASNPSLIIGFVVDGDPAHPRGDTTLLIRAVGPTLADYGVSRPLAAPQVSLYDAKGKKIDWPEVYIPEWNPYFLARAVAPQVGASPLRPDDKDFAILYPLPPGAYTVHVSGANGSTGDVVMEIFEVPAHAVALIDLPADEPKP